MRYDQDRLRRRLFGRPHRAGGRTRRARRARLPRLRVPGRAHHRARAAGAAAGPGGGLRPAARRADAGGAAGLPRKACASSPTWARPIRWPRREATRDDRARARPARAANRRGHRRRRARRVRQGADRRFEDERHDRRDSATGSSRPTPISARSRSSRRSRPAPTSSSPAASPTRRCSWRR